MESRARRVKRSLRFRLILSLSIAGIITAAAACTWSYWSIRSYTQEVIDEELRQIAAVTVNYDMIIPRRWDGPRQAHLRMLERALRSGAEGFNWFPRMQSLGDLATRQNEIVISPLYVPPGDALFIPPGVSDGFYTVLISNERVRALVVTKPGGRRFVVARPLALAAQAAARALWISILEFLVLSIIYLPLTFLAVNLIFRAVNRLAAALKQRGSDDELKPILADASAPSELDPFVKAINDLFAGIERGRERERRFIADAAHELRTPLTALSLQAEALSDKYHDDRAVAALQSGIRRQNALINSLLDLMRAERNTEAAPKQISCDLSSILISIVEELYPIAEDKDIDFGLNPGPEIKLTSDPDLIRQIVYNLTSNALKYTPAGGRVDLGLESQAGTVSLYVQDNGPGIKASELAKVFTPFYRVDADSSTEPRSGLGLAIVKAAALRLKAQVHLENVKPHGLKAMLSLKPNHDLDNE